MYIYIYIYIYAVYKWNDSLAKKICCCLTKPKWAKDVRNLEKEVNETKRSRQQSVASQSHATTSTTTKTTNIEDVSVNISVEAQHKITNNNVTVSVDNQQ